MKHCLLTLVIAGLGALTALAEPVTQISGGYISRSYTKFGHETDFLDLTGTTGGVDFRIVFANMVGALPFFGPTFTDHVTATTTFCTTSPCFSPGDVNGTLDLDVQASLDGVFPPHIPGQYPGPDHFTGRFSATGSFVAPGVDIPLTGSGTTTLVFTRFFDPDPGFFFYLPSIISYDFVPVPEPAMMFTTALGLVAFMLWSRRRSVS